MSPTRPTRSQHTTLKQIGEHIPPHLVAKLGRKHGVQSRDITPWSHTVAMLEAQLTHAIGLNDVCDNLRNHGGLLSAIRGAKAPSRNGLSHANRTRPAAMAEDLFWAVLRHLETIAPGFGGRSYEGFPRRFRRSISVVDSTTIALVANCMDWAKHRRRKAAAKIHMRLNLGSFLPQFAIVDTAKHNDAKRARELCAGLRQGEISVFDKAYVDFEHLYDLDERGVFWVTRAKENLSLRTVKRHIHKTEGNILRDDEVVLAQPATREKYPKRFRRVVAIVEINGKEEVMTFITNNFTWSPRTICELYKCRWSIEAFFKQIKQTLQLSCFLGHNRNAIRWQIWTALLAYVLLRFLAFVGRWPHSFTRLFTLIRGVLWNRTNVRDLLLMYGTAGGSFRPLWQPLQPYLPGLSP